MRCKIVIFLADRRSACKRAGAALAAVSLAGRGCGGLASCLSSPPCGRQNPVRISQSTAPGTASNETTTSESHDRHAPSCIPLRAPCLSAHLHVYAFRALRQSSGGGADHARSASGGLRSGARPRARCLASRVGPRAHSVRFRWQCLRGLHAEIPPGFGARFRRGQSVHQRPALDHLGRRRRQELSSSRRRISSIRTSSIPSTAMPSMAPAPPPSSSPSPSTRRSISTPPWCFRPNTWCA